MRPPLTVVVPTRDRPAFLDTCLASLEATMAPDDELIVVDSASVDAAAVHDVATKHGARVVRCDRPGLSRARNAGVRAAANEIVAFLDDDITVAPEWADALVTPFVDDSYAGVSFVMGRVGIPPAQEGHTRPITGKDDDNGERIDARTTGAVGAGSMAIDRRVFFALDGFDERLGSGTRFASAEDVDFFDRLFRAGEWGWYEPRALGWHDQWRDRTAIIGRDFQYGLGSGARLAKLLRTDRPRLRFVARDVLWRGDVMALVNSARRRHKFGVVTTVSRMAGTWCGFVAALVIPLRNGHFAPSRR